MAQPISRRQAVQQLTLAMAASFSLSAGCRSKGPMVLQYWHHSSGDRLDEALTQMVRDYEALNPDLRIKLTIVSKREQQSKLHAASMTRSLPDVFSLNSHWINDVALRASPQPFNTLVSAADLKPLLVPRDFERSMVGTELLSLPVGTASAHGIFYTNTALLAAHGFPAQPFRGRWADFKAFCKELMPALNPNGRLERIAIDPFRVSVTPLQVTLAFGLGAPTISEDGRQATYLTDGMREVCREIDALIEACFSAHGGYRGLLQWRNDCAHNEAAYFRQFASGNAAFLVSGSWVLRDILNDTAGENIASGPLPGIRRIHGGVASHSWSIGANRHSPHVADALALATFIAIGKEGGLKLAMEAASSSPLLEGQAACVRKFGAVWEGVNASAALDISYPSSVYSEYIAPLFAEYPYRRLKGESIDDILSDIQASHQGLLNQSQALSPPRA